MTKRRLMSLAGGLALVVVAVVVTVLTFGGHGSHGVAAQARTTPPATPAPSATPSPTPKPSGTPHPRRHHTTVKKAAAVVRHGTSGSSQGHSGVLPADPCAHNHHCYVPPAPPVKPDPQRPPVGPPVATVSGAPAGG